MNIRFKRPDPKHAVSIVDAAIRDMKFTLTLPVTPASGSTIIRNIYDCFRMLGESILVGEGKIVKGHEPHIKAFLSFPGVSTSRPPQLIENLRNLRNNISYYGYQPQPIEVEEAIRFAQACFTPYAQAIRKQVDQRKI